MARRAITALAFGLLLCLATAASARSLRQASAGAAAYCSRMLGGSPAHPGCSLTHRAAPQEAGCKGTWQSCDSDDECCSGECKRFAAGRYACHARARRLQSADVDEVSASGSTQGRPAQQAQAPPPAGAL